jgi:long-chain acyl-CoA synthetase
VGLKLRRALFDALVYGAARRAGGQVPGGGVRQRPADERLGHFFRGIGVPVLEGYGLTETSAAISVNTCPRSGSARSGGPSRPVRPDRGRREILVRGPIVFRGYRNNPTPPPRRSTDGWFRTGDVGELDDGGFLQHHRPKKEIIVTAGGKNVAPAVLEDRLRAHPLVGSASSSATAAVHRRARHDRPGCAAPWRRGTASPRAPRSAAARPRRRPGAARRDRRRRRGGEPGVSRAEQIRKFQILPGDFTEEAAS